MGRKLSDMEKKKRVDYILKSKKKSPLKNTLMIISFIGILVGIFFLSTNMTGNVVGGLNQVTLNWIGILLLVMGLAEVFFILRRNKNFH